MSGSKKCPQCAELVHMDAKICRFCAFDFVRMAPRPLPKNSLQSCLAIIGWILLAFIALIALVFIV